MVKPQKLAHATGIQQTDLSIDIYIYGERERDTCNVTPPTYILFHSISFHYIQTYIHT